MPTSTVEDYLKCILHEQGHDLEAIVPMGAIASALDVTPGTVTAMMKTLAEADLVAYEPYAGVRLTASGRRLAMHVLRRHRLIELFLVNIMGMDWGQVHEEAERLEHAVSDVLINRIDEMLGHPSVDPHGDPIPDARGQLDRADFPTLLECPLDEQVEIVRITDQSADFLGFLDRGGLGLGTRMRIESRDSNSDTVSLAVDGGDDIRIGFRAAGKLYVRTVA